MIVQRGRWRHVAAAALLAGALVPCFLAAQSAPPAPLFDRNEPLDIELAIPLRTLVNRRARRPEVVGTLTYTEPDGAPVVLEAEVTTRGHSRLDFCSFPPLTVNLRRGQLDGTLFAGQNRLKLVTRCKDLRDYEQYLRLEYVVYRIFAQVSEQAFRVRPLRVAYVDTERDGRTDVAPAFFIEHIDGLAERVGMVPAELPAIDRGDLELRSIALVGLFQFMIGNTDWSATSAADGEDCCHNSDVLAPAQGDGPFVIVPFDFDQAGLINTAYALPNERLGIRSVRERLYRGLCLANDGLDAAIATFNDARDDIASLLADAGLEEGFQREAASYVDEFYTIVNDPARRREEIVESCRGAV